MSNKVYNYLIRFSFLVIGLFSYMGHKTKRYKGCGKVNG